MVKPPPPPEVKKGRSKSPVRKFKYQLPRSFFDAVDRARLAAGYDVLPRFHRLSMSSSTHRQTPLFSSTRRAKTQHPHDNKRKRTRSLSPSNRGNAPSKKVHFDRTTHRRPHRPHQRKLAASSSTIKTSKVSHRSSV